MNDEEKTKEQLIQEVKELHIRLDKIEQDFHLVLSNIPAAVFKGYADWSVDLFDDKIEGMTGYPKADFDSRKLKWSDLILAEDVDRAKMIFMQALKTDDKSYIREYRIKNTLGDVAAWVRERSRIVCNREGRIEFISGIFFDITDRRQNEINAHKRCEYLETLVIKLQKELAGKH